MREAPGLSFAVLSGDPAAATVAGHTDGLICFQSQSLTQASQEPRDIHSKLTDARQSRMEEKGSGGRVSPFPDPETDPTVARWATVKDSDKTTEG